MGSGWVSVWVPSQRALAVRNRNKLVETARSMSMTASTVGASSIPPDVRAAFSRFDADKSGSLDLDELGPALQDCGFNLGRARTTKLLTAFDDQPDGVLDIQEFSNLVAQLREDPFKVLTKTASAAGNSRTDEVDHTTGPVSPTRKADIDALDLKMAKALSAKKKKEAEAKAAADRAREAFRRLRSHN